MTNEQMLLETWRTLPSDKQQQVLEFIKSLQSNSSESESSYHPKTELGKKLWQIRNQAIAEGKIKLLDWEGIEQEIAQRRGETE
jgi:hypothetical protein